MKAMLFAAGLGSRLRPLTNDKPKALVELNGRPLLEIAIRKLMAAGCQEIIVNVHHFADQIVDFLKKKRDFGIHIAISDEREQLLDTGGGLKKAAWFLRDEPAFLIYNVDILTTLDLQKFYQTHIQSGALATLAVRQRSTSRYLLFDEKMQLAGWQNIRTGETRTCKPDSPPTAKPLAFSGVHAVSPEIFDWMLEAEVFSIVEVYLRAAAQNHVVGFLHDEDIWIDAGAPDSLQEAEKLWSRFKDRPYFPE